MEMKEIDRCVLEKVGVALYGSRWRSDVSRDLNVSDRAMRRWISGQNSVPVGVLNDLAELCSQRMVCLNTVLNELKQVAELLHKGTERET